MSIEEVQRLIQLAVKPLEKEIEDLKRKLELQATEILILKQGGNL